MGGAARPARGAILLDAAEVLRGRHEDAARDLVREEGKTLTEARGEVRRAIDVLRFFGSEGWRLGGQVLPSSLPDTMVHTRREPVGVVGLITPWNFPIAIPAWKLAPALIGGNAVVLKPAELTPVSARHLTEALVRAGLPAGVLNVVHGSGAVVGEALVRDPGWRRSPSPAPPRSACASSARCRSAAAGCRWRWAARTHWWYWTTPTSNRPRGSPRRAASVSPARPAPPLPG